MRLLLITITACLVCVSCGKKDKPEYQSQIYFNNTIQIV